MELENCSKCKHWKGIVGPDNRSECLAGDGKLVWLYYDKDQSYVVRARTREEMCCKFYEPEEK